MSEPACEGFLLIQKAFIKKREREGSTYRMYAITPMDQQSTALL